ncbi:MAG: peptidase [Magnetococcales bacterium]|nr:peptidase [Magnetococcales bacterium]MBF0157095.1 peptidase [Magnetococcales bacterium]
MTYCVGILVEEGVVLASDSRTNAGVDHIACYTKAHAFTWAGKRQMALLSSGNLATTQAVVSRLQREALHDDGGSPSLATVSTLEEAAHYVGRTSIAVQEQYASKAHSEARFDATFILGGQIAGQPPQLFLVYPEGNPIMPSPYSPFLQIGETKYGKPILDRIVAPGLSLENAARCALVSMDSAMRSNLSVGPPLDLLIFRRDRIDGGSQSRFELNTPYLSALRKSWNSGLKRLFQRLPEFAWENPGNDPGGISGNRDATASGEPR